MKDLQLSVPDISCGHCKDSIEGGLAAIPGIERVSVDIDKKEVDLSFDPAVVSPSAIDAGIEDLGYEVAH